MTEKQSLNVSQVIDSAATAARNRHANRFPDSFSPFCFNFPLMILSPNLFSHLMIPFSLSRACTPNSDVNCRNSFHLPADEIIVSFVTLSLPFPSEINRRWERIFPPNSCVRKQQERKKEKEGEWNQKAERRMNGRREVSESMA